MGFNINSILQAVQSGGMSALPSGAKDTLQGLGGGYFLPGIGNHPMATPLSIQGLINNPIPQKAIGANMLRQRFGAK